MKAYDLAYFRHELFMNKSLVTIPIIALLA